MIDKRILLVEDDETTGMMLVEALYKDGYTVKWCPNGEDALNVYKDNPFPVVITDIEMPGMDGKELITRLKGLDEDQLIFVLTVHDEKDVIIEIMRKGVYDYIVKPAHSEDILNKLERAFEVAELRRMKRTLESEKVIKLNNQLEWFKWSDKIIQRDYDRVDKVLFESLHNSFNQGAGFGALLTLVSLVSSSAKKDGDQYVIDSQIFDLLNDNAKMAEKTLNVFSDINWIISNNLSTEKMSCLEFHSFVDTIRNDALSFSQMKRQKIILSKVQPQFESSFVHINSDYFYKALFELLINAIRFSEENSSIVLMIEVNSHDVLISVVNKPEPNNGITGIPMEYENIVFEPFFRMVRNTYEKFNTLDYGLGLTVVEKVIKKHEGEVSVSNVVDYSDLKRGPVTKVNFTITLPLSNGEDIIKEKLQ